MITRILFRTAICAFFVGLLSNTALAQNSNQGFNCSHYSETTKLFDADPQFKKEHEEFELYLQKRTVELLNEKSLKSAPILRIPVVFHIIHKNGTENISYAQLQSAIDVINEEFSAKNANLVNIDPLFKDVVGNAEIEFRLATKDPNGNCTNGVNRYYDERTSTAGDEVKTGRQWPTNKYLNVYTVDKIASGAAGYAYFPANNSQTRDGIVILHDYVGRVGTGTQGRASALTHEIGHYLALNHTWGAGNTPATATNCNQDDGVTDTPNCAGTPTCNLSTNTCGAGTPGDLKDNVQNFMDYSYCNVNYTKGQVARMRAALTSATGGRNNLWTPANLAATGANYDDQPTAICKAEFSAVGATERCEGTVVSFKDASYFNPTGWNWTFEGGTPATSNVQNPSVTYATPGNFRVTLEVSNSTGSVSNTQESLITILANGAIASPYKQGFETIAALSELQNEFEIINPSGDRTWILYNNAGFNSAKSATIANRLTTVSGRIDEILSNTFDISTMQDPVLTFQYAHAKKAAANADELGVYISTDCGSTYKLRSNLKSTSLTTTTTLFPTTEFVPTNDQWKTATIPLSSLKSTGLRYKLAWKSGGGNNIYVDNINLYDRAVVGIRDFSGNQNNISLYPNPADNYSNISFDLSNTALVTIELFDVLGKKVRTILNGSSVAGEHSFKIEKDDLNGGIYFLKTSIGSQETTKKLIFK